VDEDLGCLLERDGLGGKDEELEEAGCEILEGFLSLGRDDGEVALTLGDGADGLNCLLESPPNIIILGCLFDHLQAFKNIDNVVDSTPLDLELDGDLVELEDQAIPAFKIFDKFLAELLQTLLLAVIGQNLLL
jgi:hypothetical protein